MQPYSLKESFCPSGCVLRCELGSRMQEKIYWQAYLYSFVSFFFFLKKQEHTPSSEYVLSYSFIQEFKNI